MAICLRQARWQWRRWYQGIQLQLRDRLSLQNPYISQTAVILLTTTGLHNKPKHGLLSECKSIWWWWKFKSCDDNKMYVESIDHELNNQSSLLQTCVCIWKHGKETVECINRLRLPNIVKPIILILKACVQGSELNTWEHRAKHPSFGRKGERPASPQGWRFHSGVMESPHMAVI